MRRLLTVMFAVVVAAAQLPAQSRSFNLPEGHDFTGPDRVPFSLSADGTRLVYVARAMVFVRNLSGGEPVAVRGPVEARGKSNPIFSPDGSRSCTGRRTTRCSNACPSAAGRRRVWRASISRSD
jgi:hypothetical protein